MSNSTATEIIATYTNEADGVAAIVAHISTGYSVVLKDLDAGEIVPVAIVFPDAARAHAKAIEISGIATAD